MSAVDLPRTLPYQPVRMSVQRYLELTLAGAFTEHDSVELLDGAYSRLSKYREGDQVPVIIAGQAIGHLTAGVFFA